MFKRTINLGNANGIGDLPAVCGGLLRLNRLQDGPDIARLEECFADYMLGEGGAITFQAGRVALAAILDAMDIGEGDEVIIPAYTCVAVPNPVIACGATPVYVDIDKTTGNLAIESLLKVITANTRAIIVQHTFGIPADTCAIRNAINRPEIRLIEDCTHALGSKCDNRPVGLQGDAAFFSMEQSKVVSTGTGGIAFSGDIELVRRLRLYQDACVFPDVDKITKMLWYIVDLSLFSGPLRNRFTKDISYYLSRLGLSRGPVTTDEELSCVVPDGILKTRMPNALARVGVLQMRRLDKNIKTRKRIAAIYHEAFKRKGFQSLSINDGMDVSLVRYPVIVDDKDRFFTYMRQHDIQAGVWFSAPIHPQGVDHAAAGYVWGSCPNAEWAVKNVANLPINPRMSEQDATKVIDHLEKYHAMYSD